jgi:hypothetical protein
LFRQNWRSFDYWRWLWRRRVPRGLEVSLLLLVVVAGGAVGYAVADRVAALPAPDAAAAGLTDGPRLGPVNAPLGDVPTVVRVRTVRETVTRHVLTTKVKTVGRVSTVVERVPVTVPVTVREPAVVRTQTVQAVRTVHDVRTVPVVRTVREVHTATVVQTVTAPPQVVTQTLPPVTVTVVVVAGGGPGGHHHGH